ncbi:hypothetical protein LSTR_LSTR003020 [Laodelphax striatellus]|uniref:Transmembrane and TPR repeat-containing protein 3 n=1 Tax=Laodelphax striatellus TaxID=195883 RepID=A0A482XTG1_LAOST|nr:hypothetical protein LSTR_LSTR003020 [Laodelphax striatellus]
MGTGRLLLPTSATRYDMLVEVPRVYSVVTLLALVCYLNGLDGDFVHDDIPALTTNPDVLGANALPAMFANDFWGTPMSDDNSHKSYRPLTTLTFRRANGCFTIYCLTRLSLTRVVVESVES